MKLTFLYILASIGGLFLKIHVSHFIRFRYKQRKFRCCLSVIIGIFLGKQCALFPTHPLHETDIP